MRKHILIAAAAVAALVAAVDAAAGAEIEREPVRWHMQSGNPHMSPVADDATAKLVRTENGLSYSVQTNGLQPGHAYTVWVVVVNNPGACSANPCAPPEILTNPALGGQVTYGTGHIVGGSGQAGFGGTLRAGAIPSGWLSGVDLTNPLGAEVHLVVNDHGPVLNEYMPEMIQTYRAGCTTASLPAIFPPSAVADGTPGPNTCRLWQVAIFE